MINWSFRRIVDLTQTVAGGMAVYPGDPAVEIKEVAHLNSHGFTVADIRLNDHAGTHVETQYHMISGKQLIDEPLDRFIGSASVVKVAGPLIGIDALAPFEESISRNRFTLLATGYAENVARVDPNDPGRPVVPVPTLQWLCDRGVQLLGIDAFDFDSGPPYPGHHFLFERGLIIVEGLVGLRELAGQQVMLIVLPLKVAGTGASPCRVIALV